MAVVQNTYTGNGTTVLYSLSFPYIDQADVKVSVNSTIVTNYIFATASSIQFLTAPANGAAIRIYRETDIDDQAATIFAGSAIKAKDLNDNFTQTLYAVQESNFEADTATTTANTALTNSNTAISTANSAVSTANSAVSTANSAVSTANAASAAASSAVSTANTASSNATTAVNTANAASSAASNAVSTANTASSNATTALNTANTALSNANAAVSTANTAASNASAAVSTANTASSNASSAVSTANSALSTANTALSNSATAISTANAASAAVAAAVIYTPVVDLAALALLTPADGDFFELQDSTGAESDPSITGVTVGLVGAPGLTFRLRYDDPPQEYVFLGYFANDSETRYLKFSGGTLTGQLRGDDSTSASTPGFAFDGDANTGMGRPGADELALITGGTARLTIDPAGAVAIPGSLSQGGNAVVVTTDSRLSDTRTPTDGTVTDAKVAASAAIAGTKISPNFGSQNVSTTGTVTGASLIPTSSSVPTNGVYLPAANSVAISTNGSGRLFVNSSGQVGIGASPSAVLDVSANDARFNLTSTGSGQTVGISIKGGAGGGDTFNYIESLNSGGTQAWYIGSNGTANTLAFKTNGNNERMRIDSSGRVGIGTSTPGGVTSPGAQLEVVGGGIKVDSSSRKIGYWDDAAIYDSYIIPYNGSGQMEINNARSTGGILFKTGTSLTERGRWDPSGRLLVGTSSSRSNWANTTGVDPQFQIEYSGNARASIARTDNSAAGPQFWFGKTRGSAYEVVSNNDPLGEISFMGADGSELVRGATIEAYVDGTPGANDMPCRLIFTTTADNASGPTERARITSAGFLKATNTGSYDGATGTYHEYVSDANNSTLNIKSTNSTTLTTGGVLTVIGGRSTTDGTYRLFNAYNSNVSGQFFVLDNGNARNTNNSYGAISDVKLKENIVDATSQWSDIKALQVRKYNFKEGQTHTQIGLIAQEVELVSPGLVSETIDRDDDGNDLGTVTKSVNYSVLYMKAVKALQEAMERIETLEAKVAALEAA